MEIRASLLLDNLKTQFAVYCCGRLSDVPLLRPVFYQEGQEVERNRIYIVRPSALPPRQLLDSSNLMVCTEGFPSLSYQHSGLPLLIIQRENAMTVFNEILSIFERYDVWEKALINMVNTTADIGEMVQLTAPLILNDITVIDKDLRVIAAANYKRNSDGTVEVVHHTQRYDTMPVQLISQYKRGIEENQNKRGSFFADFGCYCVNLHGENQYYGNVSLFPSVGTLNQSDPYIIDILARYVKDAFRIQVNHKKEDNEYYKKLVKGLLDGKSITKKQMELFVQSDLAVAFKASLCFCIPIPDRLQHITAESICQTLLREMNDLLVFPYGTSIVGIYGLRKEGGDLHLFSQQLSDILQQLDLHAGVSNSLQDIQKIRFYYDQAQCALDFGDSTPNNQRLSFFGDHILHYLMMNSTGVFPAEYLCPPGLLKLREYDKNSNVDYWQTLRCFLDEQMNLAQTSKQLGVHRNTLIQRIDRIYSILGTNLKDPMMRLWLRIAIYLCDAESTIN